MVEPAADEQWNTDPLQSDDLPKFYELILPSRLPGGHMNSRSVRSTYLLWGREEQRSGETCKWIVERLLRGGTRGDYLPIHSIPIEQRQHRQTRKYTR